MATKEISKSTLKRLPTYLTYLKSLPEDAMANISATALAAALGMGEVQVRKDIVFENPGVGIYCGHSPVMTNHFHDEIEHTDTITVNREDRTAG